MTELLKQDRYKALDVVEQVAVLFAGNEGYLDDMELADIVPFRDGLVDYLKGAHRKLLEEFRTAKMSDEVAQQLGTAIRDYKSQFLASREAQASGASASDEEAGEN